MSSGGQNKNSKGKGLDYSLLDQIFKVLGGNTSSSSNSSTSIRNLADNNRRGTGEDTAGGKNLIPRKTTSQPGHQNPQVLTNKAGDKPSTTSGASGKSNATDGKNVNADIIQTNLAVDDDSEGGDNDDNSESSSDSGDLNDDTANKSDMTDKIKNNSALKEQLLNLASQLDTGDDSQVTSIVTDLLANYGGSKASTTNKTSVCSQPNTHSNGRLIQTTVELSVLTQFDAKSILL